MMALNEIFIMWETCNKLNGNQSNGCWDATVLINRQGLKVILFSLMGLKKVLISASSGWFLQTSKAMLHHAAHCSSSQGTTYAFTPHFNCPHTGWFSFWCFQAATLKALYTLAACQRLQPSAELIVGVEIVVLMLHWYHQSHFMATF